MRWTRLLLTSGITALLLTGADSSGGQVSNLSANASLSAGDRKAMASFLRTAKAYLAVEHNAPSEAQLKPTTDIAQLEERRGALRRIMIAARPDAKQGDLFTPPVAALFRKPIAQAIDGPSGDKVRRSLQGAEPIAAAEAARIAVNRDYPNQNGQPLQSAPATLLQCLPVLPKGLEYRMVGSILVLRDTEANLVVDFLPNAHK